MTSVLNCELSTTFSFGPADLRLRRGVVASLASERWTSPGIMRSGVQGIHTHIFLGLFLLVCVCLRPHVCHGEHMEVLAGSFLLQCWFWRLN